MDKPTSTPDTQEHWEIRELIARYATLLLEGRDAAAMYPRVAAHLERCIACRALLADVMQPRIDQRESTFSAADLSFLHPDRPEPRVHVTPGSSRQAFRVRIDMPPGGPQPLAGMRAAGDAEGHHPAQQGGRLLCAEAFTLGADEMIVMLTVDEGASPRTHTVNGTVLGDPPPARAQARLQVGAHDYFADVLDGTLSFEDVDLGDAQDVSLILESPT